MPYLFITDGYPEAEEFADNYIWYDAADPKSYQAARALVKEREECITSSCAKQPTTTKLIKTASFASLLLRTLQLRLPFLYA